MNLEDLTEDQLEQLEKEVAFARANLGVKGGNDSSIRENYESAILNGSIAGLESIQSKQRVEYAVSGGNDSAIRINLEGYSIEQLNSLEREIKSARANFAVSGGNDSSIRGSLESMDVRETSQLEDMVAFQRRENAVKGGNDSSIRGNIESMDEKSISELESMTSHLRTEYAVSGGNDSSIRGNIESDILEGNVSHLEAQVKQQKIDDAWAITYFKGLNENPRIVNEQEFKAAVGRSIQSNRIINKFFDEYTEILGTKLFALKHLERNQTELIEESKRLIEGYLNVYGRFMFELKMQEASINYEAMQMPDFIKENLWQQQRRLGVTFAMPIPARYNGREPFSLMGDAVSVINTMNGYTPGGYRGRILGENPEFQQEIEMEQ